jgi:hypothetical protein
MLGPCFYAEGLQCCKAFPVPTSTSKYGFDIGDTGPVIRGAISQSPDPLSKASVHEGRNYDLHNYSCDVK